MEEHPLKETPTEDAVQTQDEDVIRQLTTVICICKGIRLSAVLRSLRPGQSLEDLKRRSGCGSGGCQARRCGPRLEALLEAYAEPR